MSLFAKGKVTFGKDKPDDDESEVLQLLRSIRYWDRMRTIISAVGTIVGLSVVISLLVIITMQLKKYDVLSVPNIDTMASNVMITMSNITTAAQMVPAMTGNLALVTDALAASIANIVNATAIQQNAAAARSAGGRTLLQSSQNSPYAATMDGSQLSAAMFNVTSTFFSTLDAKINAFNETAISSLLTWVVSGIDYKAIDLLVERVLTDIEAVSKFSALATAMVGAAALATPTSAPAANRLLNTDFPKLVFS
jgi:ribosomal protein S11